MNTKNEKHLLAKVAAVMLLGMATIGGTSSVNAAGLTGSYVGVGKAPTSTQVVDKGAEVKSTETKIVDYRQTYNSSSDSTMKRTPKNNNANGEGVDGVSEGNDIDGAGTGNTAIGLGTYAARGYATAIGTYATAMSNSTTVAPVLLLLKRVFLLVKMPIPTSTVCPSALGPVHLQPRHRPGRYGRPLL